MIRGAVTPSHVTSEDHPCEGFPRMMIIRVSSHCCQHRAGHHMYRLCAAMGVHLHKSTSVVLATDVNRLATY